MHALKPKMLFRLSLIATLAVLGLQARAQNASGLNEPAPSDAVQPSDLLTDTPAVQPDAQPEAQSNAPVAPLSASDSPVAAPINDPAAEAAAEKSPDASAETQVEAPAAPVANSRGLEESSLSNGDKGHDDYKRPLLFAPDDNGLQPDNPQIKWEIDPTGKRINLGGLKLSSLQISAKLDQVKRAGAPSDIRSTDKGASSIIVLSFNWPTLLTSVGRVTIEAAVKDANKKAPWSQEITEASRAAWRKKLVRYKNSYLRLHQGSQWGFTDLPPAAIRPFRQGAPFRVCLSKVNSEIEKLKICTLPYAFQTVGAGKTQVLPVKNFSQDATVYLKEKAIGKTGLVNAPLGKDFAVRIAFIDGASVDISSQPKALELLDVVSSKDGREIVLTGRGSQPLGKKKIVDRPSMNFWAPSGVDQDTVWQVVMPKDVPTIRILGAFNLPFTFLFRFDRLPTENDRVFVKEASSTGTYSNEPVLFGYSPKKTNVASTENAATKTDDHRFEWDFAAPEVGARNRARISILNPDKSKWIAHHTLYRGYPFEASARLTGVLGTGGNFILLGELAAAAWAETIGFQNDLLSRQRWGLAARYFRAITAIQSQTGVSVSDFSTINADLKYNLVRGIWNRDQLFGLIGSIERVQIAGLSSNMGGVGAYWARTMPRIFADLFNKFPLLDYSKYVDVEFVYYPLSISSGISTSQSYNLNFHGKVFWTPRLYGEAGFGIRKYGFSDPSQNQGITFSTAYGNVGMGIIF